MLYFNSEMQGAAKYSNKIGIANILKECLSTGFGEELASSRNGQELTFNNGYVVIEHAKYIISNGNEEVITEARNKDINTVVLKSDISHLDGNIKIKTLPVNLVMKESDDDLSFLLFADFKFIFNKATGYIYIENKNKDRISFEFEFGLESQAISNWSIAASNKCIIIKTPRTTGGYNVNIISFAENGFYLSYNRGGELDGGSYITANAILTQSSKSIIANNAPLGMFSKDSNIMFSSVSISDLWIPFSSVLQSFGGISHVQKDTFMYSNNVILLIMPAYNNSFIPVFFGEKND